MINNLDSYVDKLSAETYSSLLYIAGYVFRKDSDIEDDTFFHYETYGRFTSMLDRGGLKLPGDTACEWVFHSLLHMVYMSIYHSYVQKQSHFWIQD